MAKKKLTKRLTSIIKDMLGERASISLIKEIDPELLKELQSGKPAPLVAELLAKKVIKLALDPKKSNQWAVELIFDRLEGRAAQGAPMREDGRNIERRLDDLSTEHLNSVAADFAKATRERAAEKTADEADGPTARLLDLSRDRAADPEGDEAESAVEAGASS